MMFATKTSYQQLLFVGLMLLSGLVMPNSACAAKYAGEAFTLGAGARGLALGGAMVAGPVNAGAPYWNPAGMNYLHGRSFSAMHAETFGSLLNHDFIGYVNGQDPTTNETPGLIHAYGAYLYYLGGGGIKITDLDQFGRPYVVREESHGDWLFAGAVSGKLGSAIDFGLTGKIIYRDLGVETGYGLSLDAGALYQPHERVRLGLVVTDITTGFIKYSGFSESIYPTVKPGIMVEYARSDFTGRALASADIKFENIKLGAQYWSGPVSVDTHYGWELDWRGMLFGRAGFDIGRFTTGVGVLYRQITFDFAYLDDDFFDETFRISAGYQF